MTRASLMVLAMAMVSGCATANRHVGRAALVASTLTLICDGMQTLGMAGRGWPAIDGIQTFEGNPIMGESPSVALVGAYFVGAIAANAIAWRILPENIGLLYRFW